MPRCVVWGAQRCAAICLSVGRSPVGTHLCFTTSVLPRKPVLSSSGFQAKQAPWPVNYPDSKLHYCLQVVGFVPTGWTYEMRKAAAAGGPYSFPVRSKEACSVWLIPYSEHSSFPELREYVGFIRPKQVCGWVGGGGRQRRGDQETEGLDGRGGVGGRGGEGGAGVGRAGECAWPEVCLMTKKTQLGSASDADPARPVQRRRDGTLAKWRAYCACTGNVATFGWQIIVQQSHLGYHKCDIKVYCTAWTYVLLPSLLALPAGHTHCWCGG